MDILHDMVHRLRDCISGLFSLHLLTDINPTTIATWATIVYFTIASIGAYKKMRREAKQFKKQIEAEKDVNRKQKGDSM